MSGTTTKVLRGKGRIGVGVWKGRAKAQEKAQELQGRWESNLMAKERVGPLTKAPHEHGWVLLVVGGSDRFSLRVFCLGFFLIQKRICFSLVVVPVY